MAKPQKSKGKKKSTPNGNHPNRTSPTQDSPLEHRISEAAEQARSLALHHPESADLVTDSDPMPAAATLQDCWDRVNEATAIYSSLGAQLEDQISAGQRQKEALSKQTEALDRRDLELKDEAKEFDADRSRLDEEQKAIQDRQKELQKRNEELLTRELQARTGFWSTYEGILTQAREHVQELQKRMADSVERLTTAELEAANRNSCRLAELETNFQQNKLKYWVASDAESATRSSELDSSEDLLRQREQKLRHDRAELTARGEILDEDQTRIVEQVEQQVEARGESLRSELYAVRMSLDAARERRDQLECILQKRLEADRQFGDKTPEDTLAERDDLKAKLAIAEQKLASRLSETSVQELTELRDQCARLKSEQQSICAERSRLNTQLEHSRIAVSEMEVQKRNKEVLEIQKKFLESKIDELKGQITQYTETASGKLSFPACCAMDVNSALQNSPEVRMATVSDLKEFASLVQQLIAQQDLFYSEQDVRSFLGGLAMSKLHILQGISGTGKTSLPVAFAESISAGCSVIGVQAGWREHADLIGHYNVFEKEFHETDFLKALYLAQTPAFRDRLFLVVLDEMNLSRPEQYCAELLMALEQGESKRQLTVHSNRPAGAPKYLLENGKISLPSNVWFIGTANHDETTVEFADKTYDRAHVMELPSRYPRIEVGSRRPFSPVSFEKLMHAFALAQQDQELKAAADSVFKYFNDYLSQLMNSRFSVGWGNRLERHLRAYVPVVLSAGGSLTEAADHVLATKILRKIRDRFDLKPVDMIALEKLLHVTWGKLDPGGLPVKSLSIIENEIARRGAEQDDLCVPSEIELLAN